MASTKSNGSERRPDSQQLVRQWALLRLLSESPKAWGIKELSEQLQVSKATIERDVATLERDFAVVEEIRRCRCARQRPGRLSSARRSETLHG